MTDDRMETITDPAEIRACDEPDERGDFPCCTTPAPVGAAVALDLDAIEARAKAVPNGWDRWADWQHYQILALVTPTQIDGWAHPEKRADAMERTEAAVEHIVGMDPATTLALVAEVRSLRAKVAAVEAVERGLSEGWAMLATVSDRAEFVRTFRAALATTGEGQ